MTSEEMKQYQVKNTNPFWENVIFYGDGYDVMELAVEQGWDPIAGWGRDGYDLGSWPYVIVFAKKEADLFNVVVYVEGDVTMYACPTKKLRNAIIDETAFFYWKKRKEDWVRDYESVDQLPEELRGPYRRK